MENVMAAGTARRAPRTARWAIATAVMLAIGAPASAEQLRLNPTAGQTLHLVFDQTTTQSTEVQGKAVEMEYAMGMELDWVIDEVAADGSFTVVQRFTRLRISIESPDVDSISYDSASEERPIGYASDLARTVEPLLEHEFRITLSPIGEIQRVLIPDETMDALRESPGSMPIRQLFTSEGMTDMLRGSMALLPQDHVEPGATWTAERMVQLTGGQLTQQQTYLYEGLVDRDGTAMHKISVTAELIFDTPEDEIRQPQTITDHEVSGTLWLDPAVGLFTDADVRSTLITETPYREDTIVTSGDTVFTMSARVQQNDP